ncbi:MULTISPECIES: hypothetical protein [unclassified Streptomyces]|uniref:hypothetical protein n=1 Tax=unclassified Streptomyces TaxID=2593676 RepID=UPI00081E603F|nr:MULTISPECIES: hypothetical protein [unclassified Streptomyces]MYR30537.1 hypothetical protein [Streptomyces sp. SID4945]SCF50062.1 hypothetical protein GA0115257_123714 [Streptomyces sp. LcepLS]
MARIRTIKPEFFTSLTIADLTPEQRLTFIGLWTHVDDAGRCVDDPRLIKAAVWPLDDRTAADVETDLKALTESSLITRYILNRRRYLAVSGWDEHQRINRPTPSKLPAPEQGEPTPPDPVTREDSDSLSPHAQLSEDSPPERNREGNREGKGNPPPPQPSPDRPAISQAGERPIADRMTDAFLDRHRAGNAYNPRQVRKTIADALANGTAPDEVWAAVDRLGSLSKPVTAGTLQFTFSELRRPASNVIALPGGQPLTGTDARVAGWLALSEQLSEGDTA